MKKLILSGLVLVFGLMANAQEFPVAWNSKFSFRPDRWFYDDDAKYVLGRDDEQAEVLDGSTGKSLWKLNFKFLPNGASYRHGNCFFVDFISKIKTPI